MLEACGAGLCLSRKGDEGSEEDKSRCMLAHELVSEGASLGRLLREVEATVACCSQAAASHVQRIQSLEHELSSLRFQMASAAPPVGAGTRTKSEKYSLL